MKTVFQYLIAFGVAITVTGGVSWGYHAWEKGKLSGFFGQQKQADTVVVNTTALASDVIGFQGRTPLEIKLVDGVIVSIKALPNEETPNFFRRVEESPIFSEPVGKTAAEALSMKLDAVSGATFSSKAVIANLRRGLESVTE